MNICIPVDQDQGLQSPVCGHFGSAPLYLIVDADSGDCHTVANTHHGHGQAHGHGHGHGHGGGGGCQALKTLAGEQVDKVLVAGIGGGALAKFQNRGIEVHQVNPGTVQQALDALRAGQLPLLAQANCNHHGGGRGHGPGGGGCAHG